MLLNFWLKIRKKRPEWYRDGQLIGFSAGQLKIFVQHHVTICHGVYPYIYGRMLPDFACILIMQKDHSYFWEVCYENE